MQNFELMRDDALLTILLIEYLFIKKISSLNYNKQREGELNYCVYY